MGAGGLDAGRLARTRARLTGMEKLMADDPKKRQRAKNLALLAVLVGLIVLFYAITIVRMGKL